MAQNKNIASKIWDIVNLVAFGILLLAGLGFMIQGFFGYNLWNAIFAESVTGRVFYSVFGISSLIILATILWKAFMPRKEIKVAIEDKPKSTPTTRHVTPKPATNS